MQKATPYIIVSQSEQGPTLVIDRNLSAHENRRRGSFGSSSFRNQYGNSYGTNECLFPSTGNTHNTVRFQVLIWSIDSPDVARSRVSMKFRVTLFWNTVEGPLSRNNSFCGSENNDYFFKPLQNKKNSFTENEETGSIGEASTFSTKSTMGTFEMEGRGRAKHKPMTYTNHNQYIDVPPLSIINAESFAVVGAPDVTCLRESDGLMRWTCMYKATLRQNHMMVTDFPHDRHTLCIQLGILKDRHPGATWDRRKWKLGLATYDDSRGSTRVPHGVVVDNVRIPEFTIEEDSTTFEFAPVPYGPATNVGHTTEECLEVKVNVYQESDYYDKNVIPVFVMIAACTMFVIGCIDAIQFFQRTLMLLNSAFVEVGLRMNIDNRLPRVEYQIKIQRTMNQFFFLIFYLVVESGFVHLAYKNKIWSETSVDIFDGVAVLVSSSLIIRFTYCYYKGSNRARALKF